MCRNQAKDHVEDYIVIGVHFGHQIQKCNPGMSRYILTESKGVHILDLTHSASLLCEAYDSSFDAVVEGEGFLVDRYK